MRRYFFGIKVQLLTTASRITIVFHFTVGKQADIKALEKISCESKVYADSTYTDYSLEDAALDKHGISLQVQRKSNSKRKDTLEQKLEILKMRKRVETTY